MVFYAQHAKTVLWVAAKIDELLSCTLGQALHLGSGGIPRQVSSYLYQYALVAYTASSRITYADVFILDSTEMIMSCVAATMFAKHPYDDDGEYLHKLELQCGPLERFGTFGSYRIFQRSTALDGLCAAQ